MKAVSWSLYESSAIRLSPKHQQYLGKFWVLRGVEQRSICSKICDMGYRLECWRDGRADIPASKSTSPYSAHVKTSVDMGGGSTLTSKTLHPSGTEACECSASGPKRGCGSETGCLRTGGATGEAERCQHCKCQGSFLLNVWKALSEATLPACAVSRHRLVVTVAGCCSRFGGNSQHPAP